MAGCEALVLGEGETRVAALLADHRARADLPNGADGACERDLCRWPTAT
jgi:hypothetical protein